jgi:hypothetical protein
MSSTITYNVRNYLVVGTDDRLVSGLDEISDAVDGGAVQVAAVLAVLDELAGFDVDLHL